jgi:hypothetical protein
VSSRSVALRLCRSYERYPDRRSKRPIVYSPFPSIPAAKSVAELSGGLLDNDELKLKCIKVNLRDRPGPGP